MQRRGKRTKPLLGTGNSRVKHSDPLANGLLPIQSGEKSADFATLNMKHVGLRLADFHSTSMGKYIKTISSVAAFGERTS